MVAYIKLPQSLFNLRFHYVFVGFKLENYYCVNGENVSVQKRFLFLLVDQNRTQNKGNLTLTFTPFGLTDGYLEPVDIK